MGYARLLITPCLLRELIPLPLTAEIIGSKECCGYVDVVVSSPDFPDHPEGDMPVVTPTFKKNVPVEFVDWGR